MFGLNAAVAVLERLVRGNSARLRWLAIIVPTVFVALIEFTRHAFLDGDIPMWTGNVVVTATVFAGSFFFSKFIFGLTTKMQDEILDRNAELGERNVAASTLNSIAGEISSLLDCRQIADTLVSRTLDLLPVRATRLRLFDETSRKMLEAASAGALSRVPAQADDYPPAPECNGDFEAGEIDIAQAELCVPVKVGDRVIGELCVNPSEGIALSLWHVDLLSSLANHGAVALENARLYEQVQRLAVMGERERIAREMHDGLAQVLGYVITKTEASKSYLLREDIDGAQRQLDQLADAARDVYADVREVILGLRTAMSPDHDFVSSLKDYASRYAEQTGIETNVVVEDGISAIPLGLDAELQLIRIVQEALANTRKHAGAGHAMVKIGLRDGELSIEVSDDGRGFDPGRPSHGRWPQFGMQTMRERAQALRGAFSVESKLGHGTRVSVLVPLGENIGEVAA